ncbi:hypothetical protein HOY80DRAFT_939729 [Tuber brumale]|nr:hypothetical protein HOY80DRAFT_939729 [Tuber brumale]
MLPYLRLSCLTILCIRFGSPVGLIVHDGLLNEWCFPNFTHCKGSTKSKFTLTQCVNNISCWVSIYRRISDPGFNEVR